MADINRELLQQLLKEIDMLKRGVQAHERFNATTKQYVEALIQDMRNVAERVDNLYEQLTDIQKRQGKRK